MINMFLFSGLVISLCIIILLGLYCLKLSKIDHTFTEINNERIQYNNDLAVRSSALESQIQECEQSLIEKQNNLNSLTETLRQAYENQEKIVRDKAKVEYHIYTQQLEEEYQQVLKDLVEHSSAIQQQIKKEKNELSSLQAKQAAYIKEQQHKEEMLVQKDYYRLNISQSDAVDIELLRNIQSKFTRKEAIDKLIWDVYYKPAYDILMSHLFENKKEVCGIYKITCIENDKAYIGQSVDIRERFRSHIRTSLGSAPSSNKLYQEMKKYQPCNFLFEILEEVPRNSLNERETYWIDFYKTKDYGLNNTKGGS